MIRSDVLLLALLLPFCRAEGGMAELKSITGDAPYSGVGNAPAPLPQPTGFWGRSRYSPAMYGGGMYGGGPMWGYAPDRFTSWGHSPYGELGHLPFEFLAGMLDGIATPFSEPIPVGRPSVRSFASSSRSRPNIPFRSSSPFSSSPSTSSVASFSQPMTSPTASSSSSMSGLNLGGFYKGRGN